jgi:short subunit dehydrogenase-like uncharacterized protein
LLPITGSKQLVLVYGAYGHTGRFIVAELIDRGLTPVLSERDGAKLQAVSATHRGLEFRVASVDDPSALERAMHGVAAVINAAGPFATTAPAVFDAALRARIPYLDIAAEPDVVAATLKQNAARTLEAGIALAPAIGFYGGLGDLLATAAIGDWPQVDKITLAFALSSWKPTSGTRLTIEAAEKRRGGRRLAFSPKGGLELRSDAAPVAEWDFPAPIGRQSVAAEFVTADSVTMSHHLTTRAINQYMTLAPLKDLSDQDRSPPPAAVDARGRSAQTFLIEAVVKLGKQQRRAVARGQDIYAVTAPLAVEALCRLFARPRPWHGAATAGALGEAREFLAALAPRHLTFEVHQDHSLEDRDAYSAGQPFPHEGGFH